MLMIMYTLTRLLDTKKKMVLLLFMILKGRNLVPVCDEDWMLPSPGFVLMIHSSQTSFAFCLTTALMDKYVVEKQFSVFCL